MAHQFTLVLLALACFSSILMLMVEAGLAVRINDSTTIDYRSWDPFQGQANYYSISGVMLLGAVQDNCTVNIDTAAGPTARTLMAAVDPQDPIKYTILLLGYDWLNYCSTFDDIFYNIASTNTQLRSIALPDIGAIVMDGNANSNEDFGSPFTQLADGSRWNKDVHLNISFMGSDDFLSLSSLLAANNQTFLATVVEELGPWNEMWHSIGFNILIRALDVFAAFTFVYGVWVIVYIAKANQEMQHTRRFMILVPGCIYLPLSIAFAPYKTTLPWRNAVYYFSLLFPFISLGLQMIMWGTLIYRIHRKKMNKVFSYFAYITILVPSISAFLDGIGWLIPSVPTIRMIGERGFSYATPAVILVQAVVIFYYAITFFKSLRGIAVSQTTRTALTKITVLNLAMISFFILMLLSRIVSVMGLDMKSCSAYIVELAVFRFSFILFYACCFRTMSLRQPTGSTVDSKGSSSADANRSNGATKNSSKNHTHYQMDTLSKDSSTKSGQQSGNDGDESKSGTHYNKHLSNHVSKGFTISDPSNYNTAAYGGPVLSPKLPQGFASQQQLLQIDAADYPDPYKFDEFGHTNAQSATSAPTDAGVFGDSYIDIDGAGEDKDSVYGSHRFQSSPNSKHVQIGNGNGGRVVGGKATNSEGYTRFDVSDEEHSASLV